MRESFRNMLLGGNPPRSAGVLALPLMFRKPMPSPPWHWNLGRRDVVPTVPALCRPLYFGASACPGPIMSVEPVSRKSNEPDPRLARLADKIKQVRHAQALRLRRPAGRSEDLH